MIVEVEMISGRFSSWLLLFDLRMDFEESNFPDEI